MALINCPECNKEISDTSKTCIHCGYNMYVGKKNQQEKGVLEKKRLYSEIEKHMTIPTQRPSSLIFNHFLGLGLFLLGIYILYKCASVEDGDYGILFAILIIVGGFYNFVGAQITTSKQLKLYDKYHSDPEEYKRQLIKDKLERLDRKEQQQQQQKLHQQQNNVRNKTVKCPRCGSTQIQAVPRKWTIWTSILTNRVDRFCLNCKKKF